MLIGVISDTHGLLRPEVLPVFKRVSLILHAGDIGSSEVLVALRRLAPVVAVRGNNDRGAWARGLPDDQVVTAGSIAIYMVHDITEMQSPLPESVQVVISGHSHKPKVDRSDGVLFLNPGSAGPRRFKLPISLAKLVIRGSSARAELIEL